MSSGDLPGLHIRFHHPKIPSYPILDSPLHLSPNLSTPFCVYRRCLGWVRQGRRLFFFDLITFKVFDLKVYLIIECCASIGVRVVFVSDINGAARACRFAGRRAQALKKSFK